jgi:hypothetical protein
MSLLLKDFKDNIQQIILQSNSYEELCDMFSFFVMGHKLGNPGDDVFKTVLDELEKRLKAEKEALYHGSC